MPSGGGRGTGGGSGSGSRRRGRRWRAAVATPVVAAVVAVGLAGCSHASTGIAKLTVDGAADIVPINGATHDAHSGDRLSAGDRVRVVEGQAAVHLHTGELQLRAGSQLVVDDKLRLLSGAVLIQPAGEAIQVSTEDVTVVVPSGVAQLAVAPGATTTTTVKVYQSTSQLDVAGNPTEPVSAPRQVVVTTESTFPIPATPLKYQDTDGWDHLYLAPAITISGQLAAAASGFDAQVPANQGKDAAFYQQLVPALSGNGDFVTAFGAAERAQPAGSAPTAKPGDYLIASVIAERGAHGTLSSRLTDELAFWYEGAPWGFVAYDQGVNDLTGVLDDVLGAIGRATLPFTGPPPSQIAIGPPPTSPPTTKPSRTPTPVGTTTTINPRLPRPPPTTTTTTAPPPLIQLPVPVLPGSLGTLLNPLLDPLIQALNNILGGKG
jgi:hypothetical protein